MRKHIVVMSAVCLMWMILGPALVSAQTPADLISQFLPQGVTMETATQDQLAAAVGQAVKANPDQVEAIVKTAVAAMPGAALAIVQAAVNVLPGQADLIFQAASEAAPDQARAIADFKKEFAPGTRMEGLAPQKPQREEPSPTKPY